MEHEYKESVEGRPGAEEMSRIPLMGRDESPWGVGVEECE